MLRRSLLLLPILLVACGRGGDGAAVAAPDRTTSTTAAVTTPVTASVDWAARTIAVDGDVDYDVSFCDGEAPMLCITDDGATLGVVELASFPEQVDDFSAWARVFFDSVEADRVAACDPTYVLDRQAPVAAPFAGALGVRYGFVGTAGGRAIERVVGYAINDAGSLRLLVASALADDACLSRESELPLDAMDDLEPVLAAVAKGSRF